MELKIIFADLFKRYSNDDALCIMLWKSIEKNYSAKKRYYHDLSHLQALIVHLQQVKAQTHDWDTLLFAVFYHDIIYSVLKKDNETLSANEAVKCLQKLSYPALRIDKCREMILTTKTHDFSTDTDTNFFTDADLSILGQPPDVYAAYCVQIRKEYSIYPDLIYNPGRRKVIGLFLQRERIFKTDAFFQLYEAKARKNLLWEKQRLTK